MKLGYNPKMPDAPEPQSTPAETKEVFPSLCLSDANAREFDKAFNPQLGDEITATVKLRVCAVSDDTYGSSIRFDVLEMSDTKAKGFKDKTSDEQFQTLRGEALRRDGVEEYEQDSRSPGKW